MDPLRPEVYEALYDRLEAPASRFDCGGKCAPWNGGEPFCCTTRYAIPVITVTEARFLRARTDLWRPFRPKTVFDRKVVADLPAGCRAVECQGAARCERENRTMSCRTFPFFPYITRDRRFIGLAYTWTFESRCWLISHLDLVEEGFARRCIAVYDEMLRLGEEDFETCRDHSAAMRRVFSRRGRAIPLLGRHGGFLAVDPTTGEARPARPEEFPRHGPYVAEDGVDGNGAAAGRGAIRRGGG